MSTHLTSGAVSPLAPTPPAGGGELLISDADQLAHNAALRPRWLRICRQLLLSPPLQACLLLRLAEHAPRTTFPLWRQLLMSRHGIDVGPDIRIGPGLKLPHPTGIVIGTGSRVGANVTLYQHVTLGQKRESYPRIGDGVVIFPNSVIVGDIVVGDGAVIGALSFVDRDVAPGDVVRGSR